MAIDGTCPGRYKIRSSFGVMLCIISFASLNVRVNQPSTDGVSWWKRSRMTRRNWTSLY